MTETMEQLLALETELTLPSFSKADALTLGTAAVDYIHRTGKPGVFIEVQQNGNVIFSHCMDGATLENQDWAERKLRTVTLFEHSTLFVGEKFRSRDRNFFDYYPCGQYHVAGGGFPIRVSGAGIVGMIAVSGLAPEEDHEVCVAALRALLAQKQAKA